MGSNILEERMLEDTLLLFQGGKATDMTAAQGVNLIDGWLLALQTDINVGQVEEQLSQLRDELQNPQPDEATVKGLLRSLADETQAAAEGPNAEGTWTGKLESLSKILRQFGS
ncbi:hypothetical protein CLV58_106232 [Spirosoma oryzae]|uniref:Uncharacterized protein n=1 Tax=Spirosoma oryzae TaxID=1469603 RepID=A0A2T0T5U1_9BACT|nr:hypothetical protein [Spirosoma oryzae]PRY41045.1 hypothetical protein CLV58_106232 [Spirosoma oryzae]